MNFINYYFHICFVFTFGILRSLATFPTPQDEHQWKSSAAVDTSPSRLFPSSVIHSPQPAETSQIPPNACDWGVIGAGKSLPPLGKKIVIKKNGAPNHAPVLCDLVAPVGLRLKERLFLKPPRKPHSRCVMQVDIKTCRASRTSVVSVWLSWESI